jgi:DNA-binding SARP family transcriptional activator
MSNIQFCILGPLEVQRGDRHIPIPATQERLLLATLLLNANQVVATDWLIHKIWEGTPPATARNTLHSLVYRLRNRLESTPAGHSTRLLTTGENGYRLTIARDQLDLNRFEEMAAKARRTRSAGRPDTAANQFRAALSLWRGRPLGNIGTSSLDLDEIPRLQEMYLHAVEERLDAELEAGRHAEVVAELRTLIAAHPLRERLVEQLMTALYLGRRQADALRVYADLRRTLVLELGVEPNPLLQHLHRAILRHDPLLRSVRPLLCH